MSSAATTSANRSARTALLRRSAYRDPVSETPTWVRVASAASDAAVRTRSTSASADAAVRSRTYRSTVAVDRLTASMRGRSTGSSADGAFTEGAFNDDTATPLVRRTG
ncbi:hypothetical protein AB0H69_42395 [Streptomyces phaeochromogenes]|uniref:hypothetical protein n=1 Tax=Streptomyces phaeochromogenes TaxID=1923 RepID=UPI0034013050